MKSHSRRAFMASAGAAAFASAIPKRANAAVSPGTANEPSQVLLTGNGEWTYEVVSGWGALPAGTSFGGTHGAIAQDKAGNIYVSTQSTTGILVYSPDGRLLNTIAGTFPEVHSMVHAEENGTEYFYTTVQKGTPKENWLFVKMKIDGTPVLRIVAPPEAGFKAPNEWRLTAAVPAPDGSIFIANGYGDSRIFHFDKNGNYLKSYSGKGSDPGLLDCSHGLAIDTRYDQPLLLVCDRENRRLCHFDLQGKYVGTVSQHLRRPCQVSFHAEYAIVSELEGRATILDRDNVPVAFLGDNPSRDQWANYDLDPKTIAATNFSAAHGCFIDPDGAIYISDWNRTGRVTRLARRRA
jgi:sugar lactone lactonase YvrE